MANIGVDKPQQTLKTFVDTFGNTSFENRHVAQEEVARARAVEESLEASMTSTHLELARASAAAAAQEQSAEIVAKFYKFLQIFANFWRARSRLHQNEILEENMRLAAFFKIFKTCILLHRCNLIILAKHRFDKSAIFFFLFLFFF